MLWRQELDSSLGTRLSGSPFEKGAIESPTTTSSALPPRRRSPVRGSASSLFRGRKVVDKLVN